MVYVREGTFRRCCATIPAWWPRVCYDDAAQGCEIRCTTGQADAKDEESSSDSRGVQLKAEKKKDEKIIEDKKTEKKKDEKESEEKVDKKKEEESKNEKKKERKRLMKYHHIKDIFLLQYADKGLFSEWNSWFV